MKNKLEEEFDGILNRAMPFILFSYGTFRDPLIVKVSGLFRAFNANDSITFNEISQQITEMIESRQIFDSEKERLIEVFAGRNKSYWDAIHDIQDELKRMKKKIRGHRTPRKNLSEKTDSAKTVSTRPLITMGQKKCPKCGHTWHFKGKGSKDGRITCPKGPCHHVFWEKKND